MFFSSKKKSPLKTSQPTVRADFLLLFSTFAMSLFGLIMVYNASLVEANEVFGDRFHYLKAQGIYFIIGWIALLIISRIDYHIYKRFIKYLFLGNIFLLVIILIPGIGLQVYGARRWLDLGVTTIQPAEPFKTILAIYLATWLEKPRTIWQFFALIGFVLGLIILEPDLGTAIVLVSCAFLVYFASGAPMLKFTLSCIAALLLGLLIILTSPYRRQRLTTFLDPNNDPLGTSYHIQQIIYSLGSGGFWGVGFGQSRQKYQYVPEAMTDSIFAIVGEEIGFIGCSFLLIGFSIIIWKGLQIAQLAPDMYGRLLAVGIISWIGVQFFVNLSAMVAIAPLTGIPLPLMSYGGTALVVTLASIGILLNISKHRTIQS